MVERFRAFQHGSAKINLQMCVPAMRLIKSMCCEAGGGSCSGVKGTGAAGPMGVGMLPASESDPMQ